MKECLFSVTLADCEVEHTRGSGKGGQKRNKTSSAVRIRHAPSGAVGYAEDERSQTQNKKLAFMRMAKSPAMTAWLRAHALVVSGEAREIEHKVESQLVHETAVQVEQDGKWVQAESLRITRDDLRDLRGDVRGAL